MSFLWSIKLPPRKVTNIAPTLARQTEVFPQPCASYTVSSDNQTNEMSALLAKNMRRTDRQDGRSMAAQFHHLAYSIL